MKNSSLLAVVAITASVSASIGYVGAQGMGGVRSTEIAAADLGQHFECLDGMVLKMARHVLEPGSGSPYHSHRGRPEVFYVLDGSIVEYQGDEMTRYLAGEGFVSNEDLSREHRILNESNEAVVVMDVQIIAADRE